MGLNGYQMISFPPHSSWKHFLPKIVLSCALGQGHWRCFGDCGSVSAHRRKGRGCQDLRRQEKAGHWARSRPGEDKLFCIPHWETQKLVFSLKLFVKLFKRQEKQKHDHLPAVSSLHVNQVTLFFLTTWGGNSSLRRRRWKRLSLTLNRLVSVVCVTSTRTLFVNVTFFFCVNIHLYTFEHWLLWF